MRFVLVAGWALSGLAVVAGSVGGQGKPATLLAAHRGGALLWPENSLLAFRNAVALGADFIEFDVHLSRDGEVMVIHDPTLERTTNGQGAVRDRTVAELKALRLKDTAAVARARQAGIQVGAWTVNDAAAMQRLIDAGVGVLITDQPDVAKALLGR